MDILYNVKNTHHGLVSDVTVLLEAGLALLLLGGNIVGDEGVVALLTEGVLTLDLLLVHRLRHLHHLLDAPHILVIYIISNNYLKAQCPLFVSVSYLRLVVWG